MYSKANGTTRPTAVTRPAVPRNPAYCQPSDRRRIQVPINYSGHAIVDGEERSLGEVEAELDRPFPVGGDSPTERPQPRFDDLPRVSDLSPTEDRPRYWDASGSADDGSLGDADYERGNQPLASTTLQSADGQPSGDAPSPEEPSLTASDNQPTEASSTAPASVAPKAEASPRGLSSLFDADHFPFGHGFGFDELLLIGLILFLLRENSEDDLDHDHCENRRDRGDLDETIILLGLLLLCG